MPATARLVASLALEGQVDHNASLSDSACQTSLFQQLNTGCSSLLLVIRDTGSIHMSFDRMIRIVMRSWTGRLYIFCRSMRLNNRPEKNFMILFIQK